MNSTLQRIFSVWYSPLLTQNRESGASSRAGTQSLRHKIVTLFEKHQEQLRVEKYRERGFVITEMTTAYPPTHGALVRCGPPPTISNSPIVVGAPPPYVPQLFRL